MLHSYKALKRSKLKHKRKKIRLEITLNLFREILFLTPHKSINPFLPEIFEDKKKQEFAKYIIQSINQQLSNSKNFSLKQGRKTTLEVGVCDSIFKKAQQIWGEELLFTSYKPGIVAFNTILPEVLEGLKKNGYIFSYNIVSAYGEAKIFS